MPGMKHQKSSNDFNGTVTIRLNPPTPSFPLETIKKEEGSEKQRMNSRKTAYNEEDPDKKCDSKDASTDNDYCFVFHIIHS
jgi:hypothetical protein